MDAFRWCLALGPVAIYLLLLGMINIFRAPFLVSGSRDTGALGLALSGMAIVGPIELFRPVAASIVFGTLVWAFLISLYALLMVLILLTIRPRLIVYNITAEELRPILAELVTDLDADARWAGDSLVVPNLGVQAYFESSRWMRNVSLVSAGPNQNHQGWRRLELALSAALAGHRVPTNPLGLVMIGIGVLVSVILLAAVAHDPQTVAQSLFDMLSL